MGFLSSAKALTTIAKVLLKAVNKIAKHFNRKQLIDAGKAEQVKNNVKEANNALSEAIDARRDANRKFERDGMPDDYKYYRD